MKRNCELERNQLRPLAGLPSDFPSSIQGQLTDLGRQTTLAFGQRVGHLYIKQLKFMPEILKNGDSIYLRATNITRARESLEQAFYGGMYPPEKFQCPIIPIVQRVQSEDTLPPNDANCQRYRELMAAYGVRTAAKYKDSQEMAYLNEKIGQYMPKKTPVVQVDGKPRLSGVMDTLNCTLAHGPDTKLPPEFYDEKVRQYIDKIVTEEWFIGFSENQEYRTVGIGGLAGDIVTRMVNFVEKTNNTTFTTKSQSPVKFSMAGAHDTTLAALLSSFGAFDGKWPFYTSNVAIELFKKNDSLAPSPPASPASSWWNSFPFFGLGTSSGFFGGHHLDTLARVPTSEIPAADLAKLDGYFVRVRYNDQPVTIPGCRLPGKHLDGDASFCTLAEFKRIADQFTPVDWKAACAAKGPAFPEVMEAAGW
jgi:acid phosphatase